MLAASTMMTLMQEWALTVDKILDHARNWHSGTEVVSRSIDGSLERSTYAEVHARAKRVSNTLVELGAAAGDRIGTLAWNGTRHLEVWYGVMGMGAVCHTLNPRLFTDQLIYIINEARDRIIFVDPDLLPILSAIRAKIPSVERIIVLAPDDGMPAEGAGTLCYERLLAEASTDFRWGGFDENTAAGLCFHVGDHRESKGRSLFTSIELPPHDDYDGARCLRPVSAGYGSAHRAHVSCQRLGTCVFRACCGRKAGAAWKPAGWCLGS